MSNFWSDRRAAVAKEAEAEKAALVAEEAEARETALAERSDEEILAELDLPEPETLETPEAVREFMASAVPQRLKTRALRRLWRLNPVLANLDGLVDYGQDFTDSAMVVENLQTAYQVGKGMLSHIEYLAEKAAKEAEALDAEDSEDLAEAGTGADPDGQIEDTAETSVALEPDTQTAEGEAIAASEVPVSEAPLPTRARRMTFTFEDQRTA